MLAALAELALLCLHGPFDPFTFPLITALFVSDCRSRLEITKEPFIIIQNFHDGHTGHILDEKDIRHLALNSLDAS